MKTLKYISVLFCILALFSCNDDILYPVNKNAVNEGNFFNDSTDATFMVSSIYAIFHSDAFQKQLHFIDVYGDDVFARSSYPGGEIQDKFIFDAATCQWADGMWCGAYIGIERANLLLAKIDKMKMSQKLHSQFVGEAKFLRAWHYFLLVNCFGDVPLILQPIDMSNDNEKYPVRVSKELVVEQIIKDLTEAKALLPYKYTGDDIGRATKGSAQAFLGKVYLFNQKWKEAEQELLPLTIKSSNGFNYGLRQNFNENFNDAFENNEESIFEIQYLSNGKIWGESRFGATIRGDLFALFMGRGGYWNCAPNKWLVSQFEADDTIRLKNTVFNLNKGQANFAFVKYMRPKGADIVFHGAGGSPYNLRLMRFSEVLLMIAESKNELGETNDAYQYINEVRARVKLKNLPAGLTQTEMREKIRHERMVELACEGSGIRLFDLWRYGFDYFKSMQDSAGVKIENSRYMRLPIPADDMKTNHNLLQNPGY